MSFAGQLLGQLILATLALLWARLSKLDIGLRAARMKRAWGWSLLLVAWTVSERVFLSYGPIATDTAWLQELERLPLAQVILLVVVIGPVTEELVFRGALFSALERRWGPGIAVVVPSLLWALLHFQYEPWLMASIAGSGILLAMIRWRSGSLYVPIALHAAANSLDLILR